MYIVKVLVPVRHGVRAIATPAPRLAPATKYGITLILSLALARGLAASQIAQRIGVLVGGPRARGFRRRVQQIPVGWRQSHEEVDLCND